MAAPRRKNVALAVFRQQPRCSPSTQCAADLLPQQSRLATGWRKKAIWWSKFTACWGPSCRSRPLCNEKTKAKAWDSAHVVSMECSMPFWSSPQTIQRVSHCKKTFHLRTIKAYLPTFTKRRLYLMRFMARPLGFFFLSCLGTLGVWPRTLPARAKEPWTLPADQEYNSCGRQYAADTTKIHLKILQHMPQ